MKYILSPLYKHLTFEWAAIIIPILQMIKLREGAVK